MHFVATRKSKWGSSWFLELILSVAYLRSISFCKISFDISLDIHFSNWYLKLAPPKKLKRHVSHDVYVPRIDDFPFYYICFTISWRSKTRETNHGSWGTYPGGNTKIEKNVINFRNKTKAVRKTPGPYWKFKTNKRVKTSKVS